LPTDRALKIATGLVAVVLIAAALAQARAVFEPLVLALFIIAIVWPLQQWLQVRIPRLLALAVTVIVTVAACLAFASLAVWGFSRVVRYIVTDLTRYQAIFDNAVTWLDDHGVPVAGLWAEHFKVWLAVARLATRHRPSQHHPHLLADRTAVCRPGTVGSRRHEHPCPDNAAPSAAIVLVHTAGDQ
jgi:hypothetical protein